MTKTVHEADLWTNHPDQRGRYAVAASAIGIKPDHWPARVFVIHTTGGGVTYRHKCRLRDAEGNVSAVMYKSDSGVTLEIVNL